MRFNKIFPILLFFYHLSFAFVGYDYLIKNNGDAFRYWFYGNDLKDQSWSEYWNVGTDMIKFITFPLVKYFKIPFLGGFILFSCISFFGWFRLWKLLEKISGQNYVSLGISAILLLLPNAHFWTSLIGKEALLFTAFVLLTEKIFQKKYKSLALWMSVLFILLVRPHVGAVLVFILFVIFLFNKDNSAKLKWYLSGILAVFSIVLLCTFKIVVKIKENPFDRIVYLYKLHNEALKQRSAYVPLEEYSYPFKMITFYFRPLPFEKSGLYYAVLSIDNLVFLLIFLFSMFLFIRNYKKIENSFFLIFNTLSVVLIATMYVYAYANFGLIVRTEIMMIPQFYALICSVFSYSKIFNKSL